MFGEKLFYSFIFCDLLIGKGGWVTVWRERADTKQLLIEQQEYYYSFLEHY